VNLRKIYFLFFILLVLSCGQCVFSKIKFLTMIIYYNNGLLYIAFKTHAIEKLLKN